MRSTFLRAVLAEMLESMEERRHTRAQRLQLSSRISSGSKGWEGDSCAVTLPQSQEPVIETGNGT